MAGQTMTKPRGEKTQRYVFYLGVILAAIAAVIVYVAVSSAGDSGEGTTTVPVVVANQDIPANTRLTSDMVKVEYFEPEKANSDAFTSRSQVVDRLAKDKIKSGEALVPSSVSNSAGDSLTYSIEPGMRAISVEVQEVVTAGGNIRPGDHADIVGIFEVKDVESANKILKTLGINHEFTEAPEPFIAEGEEGSQDNLVLTATLLQDVELLALAQSLTTESAGGDTADDPAKEAEAEPNAATATLELTPQQAQEITWADHYGVLRMGGRAIGDDEVADLVPTLFSIEKTN